MPNYVDKPLSSDYIHYNYQNILMLGKAKIFH